MKTRKYRHRIAEYFINVPNFPIEGFEFPDITPILERDVQLFRDIIADLSFPVAANKPDCIVCIESFGYVFGVPIAYNLGCRIVLARRAGKLPRTTYSQNYQMCYSPNKTLEISSTAIRPNDTVVIIDDFLASGGTLLAAIRLVQAAGGTVLGAQFVSELVEMKARQRIELKETPIFSVFEMRFDESRRSWVSARDE